MHERVLLGAVSAATTIADKQIPNYKVAAGLSAAGASIWLIDLIGWDSTASFLMGLYVATAAGMAVNQYGLNNSVKAARELGLTLYNTVRKQPVAPIAVESRSADVVKKTM